MFVYFCGTEGNQDRVRNECFAFRFLHSVYGVQCVKYDISIVKLYLVECAMKDGG